MRQAKTAGDGLEIFYRCCNGLIGDGYGFHPFGVLVDYNQEEGVAARR
jgi:hypothetical protein